VAPGSVEDERSVARELAELRARLDDSFTRSAAVKLHIDPETAEIVDANPAAARFYGWSVEELRAMRITEINQLPRELIEQEMARARDESRNYFEFRHRLRTGEIRDVQVYAGPIHVRGRALLESIICDISERQRLADELAHAQRMEALSRLAGSVAHDFNNVLAVVEMSLGLLRRQLRRGEDVEPTLSELGQVVASGAGLTQQLLAFCRRQHLQPEVVDLREVVAGLRGILATSAGERNELVVELGPSPVPVLADRSQLEQVVLNLVLNARDAMPHGGRICLRVDETEDADPRADPPRRARLVVTDTGVGIAPEVAPHVFEPFYTTRAEGTGLGLATVFGTVAQSGGTVSFESSDGGTSFVVLLPHAGEEGVATPSSVPPRKGCGGSETILVAEDDPRMRELVARTLSEHGYHTLSAADGAEGLERARAHPGPIHLLLTDVLMPRKGGRELATAVVSERPDTRVLYVSGYAGQPGLERVLRDAGESFLAKPFAPEVLLAKVREVLDRSPRRGARR
jgi:PAS domain S-box-containing protein